MSPGTASHWASASAEKFCLSVRDGTHDSPKFVETGYPLVTSKHISDGRLLIEEANLISESDFDEINKRSKVDQWDLLFTMIGTLGEVYLVSDEDPKFAIKNVGLFKCGDELKARWLYYWFRNPRTKESLLQQRRGVSQQYLPLGTLRTLPIAYPASHATMQAILDKISRFDDLIENNKKRIALLEEAARLLYREWFVHFRFPGHEHVKIQDGVPEGWERRTVGAVLELRYGKALKESNRDAGAFPVYGSSGAVGTHKTALAEGPAIIVGRKGNVGSVYWSPIDFWPIDTVYYIPREQSDYWLYLTLPSVGFQNTDAGVPGLNRDFAYSRKILLPSERLRRLFDEIVQPMFEQMTKLEHFNRKLAEARDLLLPRLMNGEIAV